jgi:hypothetical protein
MGAVAVPKSVAQAFDMPHTVAGFLADLDAADMPAAALGTCVQELEGADAVLTVARALGQAQPQAAAADWPQAMVDTRHDRFTGAGPG